MRPSPHRIRTSLRALSTGWAAIALTLGVACAPGSSVTLVSDEAIVSAQGGGGPTGSTSQGSGGGGEGGGGGTVFAGANELPCSVRQVVEEVCVSCHSSPVTSNAPMPLVSRYDFLALWKDTGQTVGERSVERMAHAETPMPPLSEPPPSEGHRTAIEQWVAAGMPEGTCGSIPDRPAETTCASETFWDEKATPTKAMNPGLACRSCHKQNAPDYNYFFMGTVFPSFHEQDLCISPAPSGAKVEILDTDGNVTMTLTPNASGNILSSSVVAGVPTPYTARLVANGLTRSMTTPQTDGDCNKCHTEQGDEGAPGRLVWPVSWDGPLPPDPPVMEDAVPMGGALHVTWTAVGCEKILLYRNQDGGAFDLRYTLGGSYTFQHDEEADNHLALYCYRAQCKVGALISDDSNEVCATP